MEYRILVIEDEHEIRKALCNFLARENYLVDGFASGEEGLAAFDQNEYHLVLLDMMLPNISGEEVLNKIRLTHDTPVIIISALSDELIQQDAYMQSIDDYVIKPFSIKILIYKIAALLRRTYGESREEIQLQGIRLVCNNYELYHEDSPISVTPKEFELLQVMMLNRGKVYTREQLLTLVWGYEYYGDARTIDVHIKNLRQKLPLELIKTIKGVGYKVE